MTQGGSPDSFQVGLGTRNTHHMRRAQDSQQQKERGWETESNACSPALLRKKTSGTALGSETQRRFLGSQRIHELGGWCPSPWGGGRKPLSLPDLTLRPFIHLLLSHSLKL